MTVGSSKFLCLGWRTFSGSGVFARIEVGVLLPFSITVLLLGVASTITTAGSTGIGIALGIALGTINIAIPVLTVLLEEVL